ncbi:MAG: DUF2167 domain-containing protein [Blastocatellia bacterium]
MKNKIYSLVALFLLLTGLLQAKDKPVPDKEKQADKEAVDEAKAVQEFEKKLKFEQGKITLKGGLATLNVPKNYRFLGPDDAQKVLVDAWGNPPREKPLGMLFRTGVPLIGDASWGVVITYDEEGYVKDDEAGKINYDDLMRDMKESTVAENEERQKAGYEKVTLIGWAEPPHYDKATHKLYWAQELQFGVDADHILNYDIRALGRRGVLSLNAVSSTKQLQSIRQDMQDVLTFVEFSEGNRYSDFMPGTDKVAAYGIGGLIAGKLLAKAGLFKIILAALLAAKKFVVVALVGLGAFLRKLFSRKSSDEPDTGEVLSITDSKSEEG